MISFRHLVRSIRAALRGLAIVVHEEQNFKIQLGAAVLIVVLVFLLHLEKWEAVALLMLTVLVLILELVNTVFERMIDLVKPRLHDYARTIKDILAGTVLVASVGALITALIILWPYFFK